MNLTDQEFFNDLKAEFPAISTDLDFEEGEHYNMDRFASYAVNQIEDKNIDELNKCFNFIENRLSSISHEIENALNVSFCETLLYYDHYKRGLELKKYLPPKLYKVYTDYKKYFESLSKKKRK
jgi:hypothetical protein